MKKTSLAVLALLAVCACKNKTPESNVAGGVETFCPDDNHPHMIDFGLPSGTLWSCCNMGADIPSDAGEYYAWGEIDPKTEYTKHNYAFCDTTSGEYINLHREHVAMSEYDMAHIRWGQGWHLPTLDDCKELVEECSWSQYTQNGVPGVRVSRGDQAIFIPAAGCIDGKEMRSKDSCGYYWTDTSCILRPGHVFCQLAGLREDGGAGNMYSDLDAYLGMSVRPVHFP